MAEPDPDLWPRTLQRLASHEALSADAAAEVMRAIMSGDVTPAQVGGFLMALRTKGETVDELDGLARTALEFAHPVTPPGPVLDTCGTGGDRSGTFNISTLSAIVVAGAGVAGRQARQPRRLRALRIGRSPRGPRGEDRPRCGGRRAVSRGRGDRVHVRSGLPSGVGPCGAGPPRAARAHLVQLPRSPHQPGPSGGPGGRRLRRADAPADGRGARSPRYPREALPRRGRPRRAHDDGPVARPRRPRRRGPREPPRPDGARDRAALRRTTCAGATPPSRRASPARCSAASRVPPATSCS